MDQDYYNVFMGVTYQGSEDDKGNLMIKSFGEQGIGDTYSLSPSGTILVRGMRSSSCLTMSLIVGLASYVSMSLSDAREDEKFFIKWYSWFKWIILSGYCLYVAGFTLFYMMVSASAYALFPMYCNSKRGGFSNSVWLDTTAGGDFDSEGKILEGCFVKGMKDPVGDSTLFLNIMMPMILIFCGAVTYAMHYKTKVVRRGRVRADGTLHGRWS
jgi:magnesium-transporting ATPase (P-type)